MCAKLSTVTASNNRVHRLRSFCYCLFPPHKYIIVLHAHSVCGESHIRRNASGEVTTTSPSFYNKPHRSHILFVRASHSTTSTSVSQHDFVAIGKARAAMCAKLCTMAASNNRVHALRSLYHCLFAPHIYIIVLRSHPINGESHIQRNATGEVATMQYLFALFTFLV